MAYTARFAWVLDTIGKEGFCLRPEYQERRSAAANLRMVRLRPLGAAPQPAVLHR